MEISGQFLGEFVPLELIQGGLILGIPTVCPTVGAVLVVHIFFPIHVSAQPLNHQPRKEFS